MSALATVGVMQSLTGQLEDLLGLELIFVLFLWPVLVLVLVASRDPSRRLAELTGLARPAALRRRLNSFLWRRRFISVFGMFLVFQALLLSGDFFKDRRAEHLAELAVLPASIWLPSLLASLRPRWRSTGPVRLAHLQRLSVRDTLTDKERVTVAAIYGIDTVVVIWAMWRAGLAEWSILPVAALACQAYATYAIVRRVMAAPAAGSDYQELAWDDVLRLDRARSLLESSSIWTLWLLIAAAGDLAGTGVLASTPVLVPLAGVLAVGRSLWQRSPAMRMWWRAWPASTTGASSC